MVTESVLRYTMLALFATFLTGGLVFRIRSVTAEKLDRRQEGIPIMVALRLSGLIVWAALILWFARPESLAWASLPLPMWVRVLGLPVLAFVCLWLGWMARSLGRNLTDTVVTRQEAYLVTNGPYRLVRHPMYAGITPLGVALTLLTSNWLFGVLTTVVFALLWLRTSKEERNLVARFGDSYRSYMTTTGRFFPRLDHAFSKRG